MKKIPSPFGWSFAIINGRVGEIYFQPRKGVTGIWAHCYVDRDTFSKAEQKMIQSNAEKYHFSYRNKKLVNTRS